MVNVNVLIPSTAHSALHFAIPQFEHTNALKIASVSMDGHKLTHGIFLSGVKYDGCTLLIP